MNDLVKSYGYQYYTNWSNFNDLYVPPNKDTYIKFIVTINHHTSIWEYKAYGKAYQTR